MTNETEKVKETINLRNYAHLGDAVWELFVREHIVDKYVKIEDLHNETIKRVKGAYQTEMLKKLEGILTEEEQEIKRRARNMEVPVGRRKQQGEYRMATAFESLLGYWYREDRDRLREIFDELLSEIQK